MAAGEGEWKEEGNDDGDGKWDGEFEAQMVVMGTTLRNILDVRLKPGREILANLLKISEIRKLDSMVIDRRVWCFRQAATRR